MNEWQTVAPGLERTKVPGGWLYSRVASIGLTGHGPNVQQTTGVALCFVGDDCCYGCSPAEENPSCNNVKCPCHRLT